MSRARGRRPRGRRDHQLRASAHRGVPRGARRACRALDPRLAGADPRGQGVGAGGRSRPRRAGGRRHARAPRCSATGCCSHPGASFCGDDPRRGHRRSPAPRSPFPATARESPSPRPAAGRGPARAPSVVDEDARRAAHPTGTRESSRPVSSPLVAGGVVELAGVRADRGRLAADLPLLGFAWQVLPGVPTTQVPVLHANRVAEGSAPPTATRVHAAGRGRPRCSSRELPVPVGAPRRVQVRLPFLAPFAPHHAREVWQPAGGVAGASTRSDRSPTRRPIRWDWWPAVW